MWSIPLSEPTSVISAVGTTSRGLSLTKSGSGGVALTYEGERAGIEKK